MDEYMSGAGEHARVWGLICPGSLEEVGRARRWARDVLSGHPCVDEAELVVSELGTNALTHTASDSFRVMLAITEHLLTVAVTDCGGTRDEPTASEADADSTHGRGLSIVMALACHLTVTGGEAGRTVTAALQPPARGAYSC
ncbi:MULTISPECIES: ATP-binding protein [unclassified Streptomyces]|uniref:ATP-binding protein n=1 Tax=Streptomyces sp. NBC_00060 TaxID=2975636 RepID=A0AAU2GWU3_9ACTN